MAAVLRRVWVFASDYNGDEDSMEEEFVAELTATKATEWSLSFLRPLIPDTIDLKTEAQDQEQCNEVSWIP